MRDVVTGIGKVFPLLLRFNHCRNFKVNCNAPPGRDGIASNGTERMAPPVSLPPVTPRPPSPLTGPLRAIAELVSIGYLGLISLLSSLPGAGLLFFPELAALAFDGFVRPRGTWASVPGFLAFTPVATAVVGVAWTLWHSP